MRLTAAVAAVLVLAGCGGAGTSSTTTTTSTQPATTTSTSIIITTIITTSTTSTRLASTTSTKSTSTTVGIAVVPNVVGTSLSTARVSFAAAGFNRLTANDGTHKKRVPADSWIVYSQSPRGGERVLTSVYMYLELLQKGEQYSSPGTTPCPPFVQC